MQRIRMASLLAVVLTLGLFAIWLADAPDEPRSATTAELPSQLDNTGLQQALDQGALILDIRRPEEWRETGVIEGSQLLTAFDEQGRLVRGFPERFAQRVDPEQPLVLICRTGNRTGNLSRILTDQAGYTKVHHVTDGIVRWLAEGGTVEDCADRSLDRTC